MSNCEICGEPMPAGEEMFKFHGYSCDCPKPPLPPSKPNPELDALLKRAASHVMTKEEREAQRKSWVIGEMMLEHPEMTREEAEAIYNRVIS